MTQPHNCFAAASVAVQSPIIKEMSKITLDPGGNDANSPVVSMSQNNNKDNSLRRNNLDEMRKFDASSKKPNWKLCELSIVIHLRCGTL